ncbi:hypothetical protein [Nocardia sp. NPDC004260]
MSGDVSDRVAVFYHRGMSILCNLEALGPVGLLEVRKAALAREFGISRETVYANLQAETATA